MCWRPWWPLWGAVGGALLFVVCALGERFVFVTISIVACVRFTRACGYVVFVVDFMSLSAFALCGL